MSIYMVESNKHSNILVIPYASAVASYTGLFWNDISVDSDASVNLSDSPHRYPFHTGEVMISDGFVEPRLP